MTFDFSFNSWDEVDAWVEQYINGRFTPHIRVTKDGKDNKMTVEKFEKWTEPVQREYKEEKPAPAEEPAKEEEKPAKEEKPKKTKKAAEPAPEPDEDGFKPATPEDEVSCEFIEDSKVDEASAKLLLADLIKSGKREEVKALLASYEVSKLTEFMRKCPEKLPELFEKARAI